MPIRYRLTSLNRRPRTGSLRLMFICSSRSWQTTSSNAQVILLAFMGNAVRSHISTKTTSEYVLARKGGMGNSASWIHSSITWLTKRRKDTLVRLRRWIVLKLPMSYWLLSYAKSFPSRPRLLHLQRLGSLSANRNVLWWISLTQLIRSVR